MSEKKPGPVPRPIDPKWVEKKLADGLQIQTVAGLLGMTRQAFALRRKQSPELEEAVFRGMARQFEQYDLAVMEGVRSGNSTLTIWGEKTRRGFQERPLQDAGGLTAEDLVNALERAGLTDEQIRAVQEALTRTGDEPDHGGD